MKSRSDKGCGKSAISILHAQILLMTNDSFPDKRKNVRETAEIFDISPTIVNQVRKTYCEKGLDAALKRKTRITPPHISKITGDFEVQVIAKSLSSVPEGCAKLVNDITQMSKKSY